MTQNAEYVRLLDAVRDVCWKATQYGETVDGDTVAYLVPKGALHRLVAIGQQIDGRIALRSAAGGEMIRAEHWWPFEAPEGFRWTTLHDATQRESANWFAPILLREADHIDSSGA